MLLFEEYEYVLKDVALPQVFTNDGTIWMLSTPPESAMHPSVRTIDECRIAGDFSHHDIWITEPYYGKDRIEAFLEEAGGIESTTAQREYFARIVTDASRAVVPEFTRELEHIVVDLPVPPRCARVVAADFGFRDLTVVVFCYYDFDRARIVVLDEVVAEAQSALEVGRRVHAKERELGWDGTGLVRIADAPPQLLADIYEACGISFGPAKKGRCRGCPKLPAPLLLGTSPGRPSEVQDDDCPYAGRYLERSQIQLRAVRRTWPFRRDRRGKVRVQAPGPAH